MSKFTTEEARPFIEKRGTFTTDQLSGRFKVGKMQAAGVIAHMVGKGELRAADPPQTKDGVSRWTYLDGQTKVAAKKQPQYTRAR